MEVSVQHDPVVLLPITRTLQMASLGDPRERRSKRWPCFSRIRKMGKLLTP